MLPPTICERLVAAGLTATHCPVFHVQLIAPYSRITPRGVVVILWLV
jgi:hypothetical protein